MKKLFYDKKDNVLLFCIQLNNPDMRVVILKKYAKQHFPSTPMLDYALEVEKITVSKVILMRLKCETRQIQGIIKHERFNTGENEQNIESLFVDN